MSTEVKISKKAAKKLEKIPKRLREVLREWVEEVEKSGIIVTRSMSEMRWYHDHVLTGDRKGQRAICLSEKCRVIYIEIDDVLVIEIIEIISDHKY